MVKRKHLLLLLILISAVALTFLKVPMASSQGVSLVANWVDGDLPVEDLSSELWQQTTAVEVPLSAQNVTKPFLMGSRIKTVTARALVNSSQIAIKVEWVDDSQDDSTVAVQDFSDAVALQFPLVEGQPFFCMGQQGGNVNLWHWKADWQAGILARKEMEAEYPNMYVDDYPYAQAEEGKLAAISDYTDENYLPALKSGNLLASASLVSSVEDLIAGGFGSLTSQSLQGQNVRGFGEWKDGVWQVIFSRELASAEQEDIGFSPGKTYSLAFAVWDGANEERNGQKSTSQWISLQLNSAAGVGVEPTTLSQPAETAAPQGFFNSRNITVLVFSVIAILIVMLAVVYARLPE